MLGEINLPQWRCLAELIDNSIDGFLSEGRANARTRDAHIEVALPKQNDRRSRISVTDNGPGMTAEDLEHAVRAGWSGRDAISSLGLFGMGFNIATARLGTVTTVWTSQAGNAEEYGLRIDFGDLRKQGHFRTPRLSRPKSDPDMSGTTVTIEKLKPEQRAWFSKSVNRGTVRKRLATTYAAMLRDGGVPIRFGLQLNTRRVLAAGHCVWNEDRFVDTPRHGQVYAVQKIDRSLPDRPFCNTCWQWLSAADAVCPACGGADNVVQRERRVHGWIGLQRYLSATEYGLDFIRNGRKIEIGNRDLFTWHDADNGTTELEYPIDDPRQRGRFVGEIHLDHARVTYMKDRFDRTDPAWADMVGIVRGQGPLQPQKAANLGFTSNESPLFRLYQAFRRSSPHKARVAGGWRNVLVVKDNDRAEEMASRFRAGKPEYQDDQKWWELVEEEDDKLLTPKSPSGGGAEGGDAPVPGFSSGYATPPEGGGDTEDDQARDTKDVPRAPIPSLTREYRYNRIGLTWDVEAFEVEPDDPDLGGDQRPWLLRKEASGKTLFLVNSKHALFRSATMTWLDALLVEISLRAFDFTADRADAVTFGETLANVRERYGGSLKLDPVALLNSASLLFRNLARGWSREIEPTTAEELFEDLSPSARDGILHHMALRSVAKPQEVISGARFLEYAPASTVVDFALKHPALFFDGRCWDEKYSDLDYTEPGATATAQRRLLRHYGGLLGDALWLSEQAPDDLETASRERVIRAALAVDLLEPMNWDD